MANLLVTAQPGETTGRLRFQTLQFPCALGRSGIVAHKREGDGGTPLGVYPLRRVLFRPDHVPLPACKLDVKAIKRDDGWCDDPAAPEYNKPVRLPFSASHERLWRDDGLYDLVVVLGHNDDPPQPSLGSAIFMHVAKPDFEPTEGCVALALTDLQSVLAAIETDSLIEIRYA